MILHDILLYLYIRSDVCRFLFQCILESVSYPANDEVRFEGGGQFQSIRSGDLNNFYSNIFVGDEILQNRNF